jgi:hypothetical protein
MCSWAGRFSTIILVTLSALSPALAITQEIETEKSSTWDTFSHEMIHQEHEDYRDGLSYIISGSLALAGGIAGANISHDPLEVGVYTLFQTIGVASVGYGAYIWKIGGEDRSLFETLRVARLSPQQKSAFLDAHKAQAALRAKRERWIKIVTHGLIAGLNFYNASQQQNETVRTGLYFIGGVNLLAAVSYTFEF